MGCGSCSNGGCTPAGCKSNGSCMTNGCSKLDVHDWLSHMDMPSSYKPFPVVEVKFKGSRKDFYINHDNHYLEMGEMICVETQTGGYDVGHVSLTGELVKLQMAKHHVKDADVTRKILRKASDTDIEKWKAAKDMEWETMHRARKLALDLRLTMKISDVDYQADRSKATFYYTAEGRVDFRELIKRMAEAFRIRIEMRQIGMRQEASRLGGIGSCGRELCCSTWLTDFKTVSTSAARYQNLSLNTLKLAGQCGKLKCCLNYELDTYMDALKGIPDDVHVLRTQKADARLQKTDIFKKLMWFSYPNEEKWVPIEISRVKEIQKMNLEGIVPPDLGEGTEPEDVKPAKVLDYENVVGQDSLTRLDDKNRNRRRGGGRNRPREGSPQFSRKADKPQNPSATSPEKPAGEKPPQRPKPQAAKPQQGGDAPSADSQNQNQRRRSNNRRNNRNRRPGQNPPPASTP
ncbi:MAG: hypothetical protein INR69_04030 [Mucilaginibacter polytrichastri]|nr:hypothetical protein [Mucilaginibacter polytrichastri]